MVENTRVLKTYKDLFVRYKMHRVEIQIMFKTTAGTSTTSRAVITVTNEREYTMFVAIY